MDQAKIDEAQRQCREEWQQIRQMRVYKVLLQEFQNREHECIERLIANQYEKPQDEYIDRLQIQNVRTVEQWFDSMETICDHDPQDFEPDMG